MKSSPRILAAFLACLLFSLFTSCFPAIAVSPWYNDAEVVQDNQIMGVWVGEGTDDGPFTIAPTEGQGYKLIAADKASPDIAQSLGIHLFRLNNQLYIDAVEEHIYYKNEELGYGAFRIPAHMVGKVSLSKDVLTIQFLDDTWLANSIKDASAPLAHISVKDEIVVTASTAELQAFLKRFNDNPKAFAVGIKLHRK